MRALHCNTTLISSGCAVASRFSLADSSKEDNTPKFKNSWYVCLCHFFFPSNNSWKLFLKDEKIVLFYI